MKEKSKVELYERIRRDRRLEEVSIRELARRHQVHRRTVRDALESAVPTPRKTAERDAPAMGPHRDLVRGWLTAEIADEVPVKQRHTARRIFERLRDERGFDGCYSTVRDFVRSRRQVRRGGLGPRARPPGRPPARPGRPGVQRRVAGGPGPRASQSLMLACRARALLDGRLAPSVDDVVALAAPVLRHRMALTFAARADGVTLDDVIDRLCEPYR